MLSKAVGFSNRPTSIYINFWGGFVFIFFVLSSGCFATKVMTTLWSQIWGILLAEFATKINVVFHPKDDISKLVYVSL